MATATSTGIATLRSVYFVKIAGFQSKLNLQLTPMDSHAASTSGPASCLKTFSFMREPLKVTYFIEVSTSLRIGALNISLRFSKKEA